MRLITAGKLQERINKFWRENKNDLLIISAEINRCQNRAVELKKKSTLWTWMKESPKENEQVTSENIIIVEPESSSSGHAAPLSSPNDENPGPKEKEVANDVPGSFSTPAQDKLREQLNLESRNLARLNAMKESGLATQEEKSQLGKSTKLVKKLESELKRKQNLAVYSRNVREKKKKKMEELKAIYPEMAVEISNKSGTRTSAGRPRIEENFPTLLQTIVDIVAPEASADERRRSELLRSCTSLDDLKKELEKRIEGIAGAGLNVLKY